MVTDRSLELTLGDRVMVLATVQRVFTAGTVELAVDGQGRGSRPIVTAHGSTVAKVVADSDPAVGALSA